MAKKTYRKYQNKNEVRMCDPKFWRKLNLEAVRRYGEAKLRGRTKWSDALVEKYRAAVGIVIKNGFYWHLEVRDMPGQPLKVMEYPAAGVGQTAKWYWDLGNGWSADVDPGSINFWWTGDSEPREYADVIAFAEENGVSGATEDLLRRQVANILSGFKVQTRISSEWVMFSPIADNGIRIRFIRDAEGESYIA